MSKSAVITWVDPASKITGMEIAMRAVGAVAFNVVGTVQPGVETATIGNLIDGDYEFRVTSINGTARSIGVVVAKSVVTTPPVDAVPDDPTNVIVTIN